MDPLLLWCQSGKSERWNSDGESSATTTLVSLVGFSVGFTGNRKINALNLFLRSSRVICFSQVLT